jgi:uncharacterized membrane protein
VGGEGKSWGDTLDELARDIAARVPPVFDIEKVLYTYLHTHTYLLTLFTILSYSYTVYLLTYLPTHTMHYTLILLYSYTVYLLTHLPTLGVDSLPGAVRRVDEHGANAGAYSVQQTHRYVYVYVYILTIYTILTILTIYTIYINYTNYLYYINYTNYLYYLYYYRRGGGHFI